MRGSVWQFCYVSTHFRYILTTIVLIRNTFFIGYKVKNPLLMQSTHQEGYFFGKNGHLLFAEYSALSHVRCTAVNARQFVYIIGYFQDTERTAL